MRDHHRGAEGFLKFVEAGWHCVEPEGSERPERYERTEMPVAESEPVAPSKSAKSSALDDVPDDVLA